MKKRIGVLLLLLLVFVITSCGQLTQENLNVFDGVIYNYDSRISVNDVSYDVYLPETFNDNIFYKVTEGELTSDSDSWILNFENEIIYYSDEYLDFKVNK